MADDVSLAAVLVLVAALVVAPVAAAAPSGGSVATFGAQDDGTTTPEADENASVQPGERLAGVVSVQQAELEGEVDERTFGVAVARANSDDSKARVVAQQLDDVEERIDALEQRQERLEAARENGSISEGEYRAKMARTAAELATARRLTNASEATVQDLPADVLAKNGIDAEAIQTLKDRAGDLSGQEVAEIARSIAGGDVGGSMAGNGRPVTVGEQVPGEAGNSSGGVPDDPGDAGDAGSSDGAGDAGGAPNGSDVVDNGTDVDDTDLTGNDTDPTGNDTDDNL